jgi:hypothetical protein
MDSSCYVPHSLLSSRYARDTYLRPAPPDEIAEALAVALQYDGRKRIYHADEMMARITADQLVRHLEASGFVVMKAPPAVPPTTSNMPTPTRG